MDFIITWVDGNDPEWRNEMLRSKNKNIGDQSEARFRDWENLHYWFRGVENFAPWVNKIHFVTWGHIPPWLNTNHPKLNIVRHEDYIPEKYLPTFNSRTIDINFHRIKELSEEYVYFNDDMFIIDNVDSQHFFRGGKPCDTAAMSFIVGEHGFNHTFLSNMSIINSYFDKSKAIRGQPFNWFNIKYGMYSFHNFLLWYLNRRHHTGFANFHLPKPLLKKTLANLWEIEPEAYDEACKYTFRNEYTINVYLQHYWELASNNFYPIRMRDYGKTFRIREKLPDDTIPFIKNQKKPLICLNDYDTLPHEEYLKVKNQINKAFNSILPNKSDYEL